MRKNALFIKHTAKPGRRDDLRQVWEKYVRNYVANSDGQPAYFYCYDDNDPNVILVFQTHANAESAGEFTQQPWYADYERESAAFIGDRSEYRAATPQWVKKAADYLLREIFELEYADVAVTLEMNEAACRKLVSRANARIGSSESRCQPSWERQRELLAAFEDAVRTGRSDKLTQLLVSDVRLTADGGGKVVTVADICHGKNAITFLTERLSEWWKPYEWYSSELNGMLGLVLRKGEIVVAAISFSYDAAGLVDDIYIMRNPDKLERLHTVGIH